MMNWRQTSVFANHKILSLILSLKIYLKHTLLPTHLIINNISYIGGCRNIVSHTHTIREWFASFCFFTSSRNTVLLIPVLTLASLSSPGIDCVYRLSHLSGRLATRPFTLPTKCREKEMNTASLAMKYFQASLVRKLRVDGHNSGCPRLYRRHCQGKNETKSSSDIHLREHSWQLYKGAVHTAHALNAVVVFTASERLFSRVSDYGWRYPSTRHKITQTANIWARDQSTV